MSENKPLVSIGMPLYNGQRFLDQALRSLLAQDFKNFELIISDNASTDGTREICSHYAAMDPRIRLYWGGVNQGAAWNFKRVFDLSNGQYFMWAAHDDLWAPNYITECLRALEQNPSAVLCCSNLYFMDVGGKSIPWQHPNIHTVGMDLRHRVQTLMQHTGWFAIYGLIRSEALRKANLGNKAWGADVILLLELLLMGDFVKTTKTHFNYRILPRTPKVYDFSIDPQRENDYLLHPYTKLTFDLLNVIRSSALTLYCKLYLQGELLRTVVVLNNNFFHILRKENQHQLFECYNLNKYHNVLRILPYAILLNPCMLLNMNIWMMFLKSIHYVYNK